MPLTERIARLDDDVSERARILVVDDLAEKLLVFRTVLEELGDEIVCVRSGGDALKEILKGDFAVILLDVNMPDIDGFEVASLIRQYRRTAHTPIIFITSHADEMQALRGYSLGGVDYILAPVVPAILRSKVKVFVDLHLMQRRLHRQAEERVALAAAQVSRSIAENNTRRSNFLAEASRSLGSLLDTEAAVSQLLEMLIPRLVPEATVALFDEQGALGLVMAGEAVHAENRVRISRRDPGEVSRACQDVMASAVSPLSVVLRSGGGSATAIFPLVASGGVSFGGIVVRSTVAEDDADTIRQLAERAAIAVDHARLYRNLQVEVEERRSIEVELKNSNRRKDEFLAMLSHELRNPLAPIRTALEIVRRIAPDEARLHAAIDIMGRQVRQMTRLVDDLLDATRISEGKITLKRETIDMRTVIAYGVETVGAFMEARGHRLEQAVPDAAVPFYGDYSRLSQIVANLLHNAAKYTGDGGVIRIALSQSADHVVISVRDNGIGIDAELLPRVFNIFEQGGQPIEGGQGGLGVGLTLALHIVRLHQGSIQAISEGRGRGSEFVVQLPIVTPQDGPWR